MSENHILHIASGCLVNVKP